MQLSDTNCATNQDDLVAHWLRASNSLLNPCSMFAFSGYNSILSRMFFMHLRRSIYLAGIVLTASGVLVGCGNSGTVDAQSNGSSSTTNAPSTEGNSTGETSDAGSSGGSKASGNASPGGSSSEGSTSSGSTSSGSRGTTSECQGSQMDYKVIPIAPTDTHIVIQAKNNGSATCRMPKTHPQVGFGNLDGAAEPMGTTGKQITLSPGRSAYASVQTVRGTQNPRFKIDTVSVNLGENDDTFRPARVGKEIPADGGGVTAWFATEDEAILEG